VLMKAIGEGPRGVPDHAYRSKLSDRQIFEAVAYMRIRNGQLTPKPYEDPNGKVIRSRKQAFRIETVATGFEIPTSAVFLPDGRILVTERPGRVRVIKDGKLLAQPVSGIPVAYAIQDGGIFDIRPHPNYAQNGWIYLSFSEVRPGYTPPEGAPPPSPGSPRNPPSMTRIVRGKLTADNRWVQQEDIFKAPDALYTASTAHYGCRLTFDGQGHLYFTLGERGVPANAQTLTNPLGKIHRINDDGSVPTDNPFVDTPGAWKSIWSYGHRNADGLSWDPRTGLLWGVEHGPTGGDEVNIIEKGKNYGWGVVSLGIQPGIMKTHEAGMVDSVVHYTPSIGPSGIRYYTGDKYPGWKNSLFIAGLIGQKWLRLETSGRKVVSQEAVFSQFGRVRTQEVGPDGLFYVLVQAPTGAGTGMPSYAVTDGSLIRIVPIK
jgi:glucose/arabinose dehydrogenase